MAGEREKGKKPRSSPAKFRPPKKKGSLATKPNLLRRKDKGWLVRKTGAGGGLGWLVDHTGRGSQICTVKRGGRPSEKKNGTILVPGSIGAKRTKKNRVSCKCSMGFRQFQEVNTKSRSGASAQRTTGQ